MAAFAFEFVLGEGGFAGEFVDELQERLGKFAEAGEADGAGVLSGAAAEIGAQTAQVFFNLAAGALRGAGAHERGGHFGEAGGAVGDLRVAGAEIEFTMKFGNGVRFGENDFEAVGEARAGAPGPGDRALRSERGNSGGNFSGTGSHYAASFLPRQGAPVFAGARKTMARFSGSRYFFGDALDVFALHGQKAIENRIDEFRIVVEKREAGEQVHQAIARHVAAATALESGVIVGAPFHLDLLQFVFADAVLLDFVQDRVERGERGGVGDFRLVQDARDHLRWAVVIEKVVHAALGFDRDLLFEHEFAVHAAGAPAMQRLIQHRQWRTSRACGEAASRRRWPWPAACRIFPPRGRGALRFAAARRDRRTAARSPREWRRSIFRPRPSRPAA